MKRVLFLFTALVFSACGMQKSAGCPDVMCTQEFKFLTVKLISGGGKPIDFKRYEVKLSRTGKKLHSNPLPNSIGTPTTLVLADDGNLKTLSPKGDDLSLTIYKNDGTSFTTAFKASGGICNCHVSKLTGPDEIDMDGK